MIKKISPVLVVDRIEHLLPLWKALGFTVTVEVPHGDALGFVILVLDDAEVMYQTLDSVRADEAKVMEGGRPMGAAALFIEVESLEAVNAALPSGTDVVVKNRKTFYGSTETIVRDGAGNVVTFAEMG